MRLLPGKQPGGFQVDEDFLARLEPVEPQILRPTLFVDARVLVQDGDHRQLVPEPRLVVVKVVGRRHLHHAGAERHVHQLRVRDDGDLAVHERQQDRLSDQPRVAFVVGVNRERGVAEEGLRPGCRHGQKAVCALHRVSDVPERALALLVLHLQVRERGVTRRAPIDELGGAVDEALLVQAHEDLLHRERGAFIEREPLAAPIERRAERIVLLLNPLAVPALPLPDALHELLASEVVPALLLRLLELPLHHHLGGDAGVVRARLPEDVVAAHPFPADEDVLNRRCQRMPDMQRARDVGRRKDDAERRFVRRLLGTEAAVPHPLLIPAGFDFRGVVGLRKCVFAHPEIQFLPSRSFMSRSNSSRMIVSASCGTTSQAILSMTSREARDSASRRSASPPS